MRLAIKRYVLFDRVVSEQNQGQFTVPFTKNIQRYNIRMLNDYCLEKRKKPEKLTEEELIRFRIK